MSGTAVPKSFRSPWAELINMTGALKYYSSFGFNVRLNVSKCKCFYPKTFMFQDNSLNCELQKVLRLWILEKNVENVLISVTEFFICMSWIVLSRKDHLFFKKWKKMEANRNSKNLPKFPGYMNGRDKTRKLISELQCGSFYLMNRIGFPAFFTCFVVK